MEGRLDALEAEVQRLRDWRHDVAVPRIIALERQVEVTAKLLEKTAATLAAMEREDEFAARLDNAMRKRRLSNFSISEKLILLAFAAVPAIQLALTLSGHPG